MARLSAFNSRDGMFELLGNGEYNLSPTAAGLLWFMLFHTIYDPGSRLFQHVNPLRSTVTALSLGTRRGERSVQRGLGELETLGFIERIPQFGINGYQQQNLIKMITPSSYCWAHCCRGHRHDEECEQQCFS